ncbi:uncharacterized protein MONOS_10471 [Monocercomonoides exilis]|uniref:uncharacterized protein n=1 Tax=Monocercomonoides exilis TaxID=2049356 RepID=UPI00355AC444|nr:hypothetical protein MONOS_10471 [Monocercomonoides exilis]|eukprot:MONOS_10471.1-p1 / transcript=MONOS_10471.1 / gene=MONOS_10471 / organism=Monocercomonoides_exilis_PA203 / gene_product=unspecified product / transcript_product=unspecified product / location=Mono_scaffold00477:48857-49132(+) / protein_length=92 / sequence_SO=supercontig / SO=protein_coding / is_pseudo=false
MDDIEKWLWIVVPEAAGEYINQKKSFLRALQTFRGIWRFTAGCAEWGCCVCIRCGSFRDAFSSAGGAAPLTCSISEKEVGEQVDLSLGRCE